MHIWGNLWQRWAGGGEMGYDAGDDHGQSKEGPQKHDDEGADGGEEKAVSGSIGSEGKQNRAVKRRMDARRALLFA